MPANRLRNLCLILGAMSLFVLTATRGAPQAAAIQQDPVVATSTHAKELYEAAKEVMDHGMILQAAGRGWHGPDAELEREAIWSLRLAQAAHRVGRKQDVAEQVTRMQQLMTNSQDLYKAGRRSAQDVAMWRYYLAEVKLLRDAAPGAASGQAKSAEQSTGR